VRQAGVAHIPEDRLSNGLSLASSIDDNLIVDRLTSPLLKKGWSLTKKLLKTMERN
jgi:simple sugar transport system ATP-binding protein